MTSIGTATVTKAPGSTRVQTRPRRNSARGAGRHKVTRILYPVIAVILFCLFAFPVYWMVNTSFQPSNAILSYNPSFFPTHPTLRAYRTALADDSTTLFSNALKNSLMVTLLTLVVALVVGFIAAIAVSRYKFKGRRTFIIAILVIQMIPGEATFVSIYKMLDGWHMTNSIGGLGLVYIATVIPFTLWTLRGFVNGVPVELEEAAQIDGCSRAGAFWRITFPLLAPGLVATGVFAFIQAWNEFVMALVIMTRPDNATLTIWQRSFQQATRATDWSALMAGSVLMAIPVVIFFLIVQGRMTGGMVSGAVKG